MSYAHLFAKQKPMNKIQERQLKELNEVVEFYGADTRRRAVDEWGDCQYLTEDNRRCAIGRKVCKNIAQEMTDEQGLVKDEKIFNLLPKTIQKLNVGFLRDLQKLHDNKNIGFKRGNVKV